MSASRVPMEIKFEQSGRATERNGQRRRGSDEERR